MRYSLLVLLSSIITLHPAQAICALEADIPIEAQLIALKEVHPLAQPVQTRSATQPTSVSRSRDLKKKATAWTVQRPGDKRPTTLQLRQYKGGETVAVYINEQQVVLFRTPLRSEQSGLVTPVERGRQLAEGLVAALNAGRRHFAFESTKRKDGGLSLSLQGEQQDVLLDIDKATAQAAQQPLNTLAKAWTNQLTQALALSQGKQPVPELNLEQQANLAIEESTAPKVSPQDERGSSAKRQRFFKKARPVKRRWRGVASWYGIPFHGRTAADGSRFDMNKLTAAHKTLKFGTRLRVRSVKTGRSVIVKITDRGPFIPGREIDLSKAAAAKIGLLSQGVGSVILEELR